MKTKSKALLLTLCAALLVAASVLGTMAYLTDTETVTNTFTVGKVDIKLDEAKVNENGQPVDKDGNVVEKLSDAPRVNGNEYHLLPGHSYTKDPTVTVLAGSEKSYVRMLVTATFDKVLNDAQLATQLDDIFTGYDSSWARNARQVAPAGEGDKAHTVITYEYRYATTVSAGEENNVLPALFTGITIPGEWTNEQLAAIGGIQIEIVAHAIQAEGFADAAAAWAAYAA